MLTHNFIFSLQLSEMTVDLAEEHSAANLASERLELEAAERMRLESEVHHLQVLGDDSTRIGCKRWIIHKGNVLLFSRKIKSSKKARKN